MARSYRERSRSGVGAGHARETKENHAFNQGGNGEKIWLLPLFLFGALPVNAALAATEIGGKEFKNTIDMEFVLIPSGSFHMGSDKNFDADAGDDELSRHQVTISTPFYLGKYEVTQEQWSAIIGNHPSNFKGRTRPVERVSWNDVQKFIAALNQKEGKSYRLPTEAEWEYAARAGTKTVYSLGDEKSLLSQYAWHDGNSGQETHPVGQLTPNAWGLYDMHGNVWEWCSDWYDKKYNAAAATDPQGPSTGSYRVFRGGSWNGHPRCLRSAARLNDSPGNTNYYLGFRLLLPVQEMKGTQAEKDQQAVAGQRDAARSASRQSCEAQKQSCFASCPPHRSSGSNDAHYNCQYQCDRITCN